jgi:pyrophosphatase PpaX
MLEVGGDHTKVEIMVKDYREHNRALIDAMPLFPYCFEVVSELKRAGIKVGLVTSKNRHSTFKSLDLHGLTGLLDVVITKDDTEKHKPDPEPLIVATSLLGVHPSQTAYVGDSVYDIQCAKAAGCLDIAALWGAFDRELLLGAGPTHWVELPQRLLELNFGLAKINCKLP